MALLAGRTALITGAASGIGKASAELFAAQGARVIAMDVSDGVRDVVAAIGGLGHVAIAGDIADPAVLAQGIDAADGALDIAFANAGVSGGMVPFLEIEVAEWERVLRVNLIGAFLTMQAAARVMVPRGRGAIIATASVAGLRSGAGGMPYSASKAGVVNMVQTAANHLAGSGVRVNGICPGLTETGMTKPMFDGARARGNEHKLGQLNPLKRYATPDEMASVALFLASDLASYVNGQVIAVDGGLSSSHPTVPGKLV